MRRSSAAYWFAGPGVDRDRNLLFLAGARCARHESHRLRSVLAQRYRNLRFIGFENYWRLLHEPLFWKSLGNTFYFVLLGVPLSIGASLAPRCW